MIEHVEKVIEQPISFKPFKPPKPLIKFKCEKKTYATKSLARESLKRIREEEGNNKKPIRSYECPYCSGWHLTSIPIEGFEEEKEEEEVEVEDFKFCSLFQIYMIDKQV